MIINCQREIDKRKDEEVAKLRKQLEDLGYEVVKK